MGLCLCLCVLCRQPHGCVLRTRRPRKYALIADERDQPHGPQLASQVVRVLRALDVAQQSGGVDGLVQ
jgi:hypothetical protein